MGDEAGNIMALALRAIVHGRADVWLLTHIQGDDAWTMCLHPHRDGSWVLDTEQ